MAMDHLWHAIGLLLVKRRLLREINSRKVGEFFSSPAMCPLTNKKEVVPADMDEGKTADTLTYSRRACPISQGHALH